MSKWRELKMTILTYPRDCGCIWTRARDFIFYCDEHATDEDKKKISADYSWKFGDIRVNSGCSKKEIRTY